MKVSQFYKKIEPQLEKLLQEFITSFENPKQHFFGLIPNVDDDFNVKFLALYYNFDGLVAIKKRYTQGYMTLQEKIVNYLTEEAKNFVAIPEEKQELILCIQQSFNQEIHKAVNQFKSQSHNGKLLALEMNEEGSSVFSIVEALSQFKKILPSFQGDLSRLRSQIFYLPNGKATSKEVIDALEISKQALQAILEKISIHTPKALCDWMHSHQSQEDSCFSLKKDLKNALKDLREIAGDIEDEIKKLEKYHLPLLAKEAFKQRHSDHYKIHTNTLKSLSEQIGKLSTLSFSEAAFEELLKQLNDLRQVFNKKKDDELTIKLIPEADIIDFFQPSLDKVDALEKNLKDIKLEVERIQSQEIKAQQDLLARQQAFKQQKEDQEKAGLLQQKETRKRQLELTKKRKAADLLEEETCFPELKHLKNFIQNRINDLKGLLKADDNQSCSESEVHHYQEQKEALTKAWNILTSTAQTLPMKLMQVRSQMLACRKYFNFSPEGANLFETIMNFISICIKKIQAGTFGYEVNFWRTFHKLCAAAEKSNLTVAPDKQLSV